MMTQQPKSGYKFVKGFFGKFEEIPNNWRFEKIKNLGKIVTGKTPSTKIPEYYGGKFLWAGPTDLNNTKFVIDTKTKLTKKGASISRIIPRDSIMFSCIGEIGKIGITNENMSTNQQINSLICKNDNPEFVYYQLAYCKRKIAATANISIISIINKKDFGNLSIAIPTNKSEQQKIVDILSNVDAYIRNITTLIELSKRLKKGLMQKLFTKGISHSKFKKIKWLFKKEIEIPESWKYIDLVDISKKITDGEHKTPELQKNGIMLLSARNIKNGYIDLNEELDYISEKEYTRIKKRCNPEFGDILISCSGTIGRITSVKIKEQFGLVRSVALVKLDRSQANPIFIENFLQSNYPQTDMISLQHQTSQANLFQSQIKKIKIFLPDLPEQERIISIFSSLDTQINWLNSKQLLFQRLKKGLMQKLLTGKIRVKF